MAEGAMQCGFCTSGMILSSVALLKEQPKPSEADILSWMNGHICRCGTYPRILKAVRRAETVSPIMYSFPGNATPQYDIIIGDTVCAHRGNYRADLY